MKRRNFLIGSASGLSALALVGCVPEPPTPTPTPTPTGEPTPTTVPRPSAVHRTSWSTDPFALGAFSYQPVGSLPDQRVALRQPVNSRIFFAGEHTDEVSPGTVQGAQTSGERAADAIAQIASSDERIAVIGAGIAGATAARRLADAGFSVVVVEGSDRSGGRIKTLIDENWPGPVELGAAWVRDSSRNTLLDELTAQGIDAIPFDAVPGERTPAGTAIESSPVGADAVTAALAWADTQPADVSVADALTESGAGEVSDQPDTDGVSDRQRLDTFLSTRVDVDSGADPSSLSAWFPGDPTRSTDDDRYVTGEFQSLVTTALDGIDILPSSAVAVVSQTDRGVSLRLSRGDSLSADRVVVTVPLGVLKSGAVTFDPVLPFSHRSAISALGMGMQEKMILRFDEPFWSTDDTVWTIVGPDVAYPLWYNMLPLTGEPILVGVVGADAALRQAKASDDDALDAALESLVPFVDTAAATPTPTPTPAA